MKRLTTLLLVFLFVFASFGQSVLTYGDKVLTYGSKVLYSYCPEADAVFAAMGTEPDLERKKLIDNMIRGLKEDGIWTKLDIFYVLAAHAENSSLLNLINPGTFDCTNYNSTTFEIDRGYTGNGSNTYLGTNYNPAVDAINYALNDASYGVYITTDVHENNCEIGNFDGTNYTYIYSRHLGVGNKALFRINNIVDLQTVNTDSRGFYIGNRTGANARELFKNAGSLGNDGQVSTGLVNNDLYVLCINNNGVAGSFSTKQVASAFAGAGMTQTNVNNFTDRIETFMDAIGAGVISEYLWLIILLIPNIRRRDLRIAA